MRFILTLGFLAILSACAPSADAQDQSDSTQTESSSDLTPFSELYDNGQIRIQGWLKDEKREGRWISFYQNGVRWSEDTYRNGKKDGPTKAYYPSGILKYSGIFLEDREAGTWNFYEETGKLVEARDFNPWSTIVCRLRARIVHKHCACPALVLTTFELRHD